MKKNSIYALMSAIALSGAIGFSSCSSTENDVAEVNPGYDPATGDVPVQFVFNVSMGNTPTTRQSAEATQANYDANDQTNTQKFRGIDHCLILSKAQKVGETTDPDDGKYISSPTTMDKMYDLSRVLDANAISSTNSRRVLEMAFPLNTNSLMFYGKAIVGDLTSAQTLAGLTQHDVYGHLKTTNGYNVSEDLNNVSFEVQRRLSPEDVTKYKEIQKLLAGVLSTIMNTNLAGTNQDDISATGIPGTNITPYGFTITKAQYNPFYWADYYYAGNDNTKEGKSPALPVVESEQPLPYSVNLTPLEEKLANAYKAMITIDSEVIQDVSDGDELRAGAGDAVEAMIQDLWSIVNSVRCATPTGEAEAIAKYMAAKIHSCIDLFFDAEDVPTNGGPVTGVHFGSVQTVVERLTNNENKYWPSGAGNKPTTSDFTHIDNDYVLGKFPYSFHLPAGATHLAFDNTKKEFSYIWEYSTAGMENAPIFTVESYYFPPELLYFGNSPIRVCSKERQVEDYPSTVADWHDEEHQWQAITEGNDTWSWYKNSHVIASTRSVAMINDINYGTALLKTKVGYKLDQATGLNDNNDKFHNGEGANIIPVDDTSFQLVGLLVGGQSKKVGWDFLPMPTSTTPTEQYTYGYVYDCDIANTQIPASGVSIPNYTLVFDNYHAGAENQDVVYVSLELKNNSGKDFYGKNGLIKNGEKFYLIGKLAPTEASNKDAIVWPTYHPMPPYDADGNSIHVPRVFMQDYMTSVNFKIGVNSLKYAYLTVPDLRSSSLTLGLAVDIEWRTGLDFGNVIVGGE